MTTPPSAEIVQEKSIQTSMSKMNLLHQPKAPRKHYRPWLEEREKKPEGELLHVVYFAAMFQILNVYAEPCVRSLFPLSFCPTLRYCDLAPILSPNTDGINPEDGDNGMSEVSGDRSMGWGAIQTSVPAAASPNACAFFTNTRAAVLGELEYVSCVQNHQVPKESRILSRLIPQDSFSPV
ncbi:hypothetical protein Tco_0446267 [Tanacetum coccineum]